MSLNSPALSPEPRKSNRSAARPRPQKSRAAATNSRWVSALCPVKPWHMMIPGAGVRSGRWSTPRTASPAEAKEA